MSFDLPSNLRITGHIPKPAGVATSGEPAPVVQMRPVVRRLRATETLTQLRQEGWVLFTQQPLLSHLLYPAATDVRRVLDPLVDVMQRLAVAREQVEYWVLPSPVFSGLECALGVGGPVDVVGNYLLVGVRQESWSAVASMFHRKTEQTSCMTFRDQDRIWSVRLEDSTVPDTAALAGVTSLPDVCRVPVVLAVTDRSSISLPRPEAPWEPLDVRRS